MFKRFLLVFGVAVVLIIGLGGAAAGGGAGADCAFWHRVIRCDTLSQIATRYDVSMDQLAQANGILNRNRIYVGQNLCVPHRVLPTVSQIDLIATYHFNLEEVDATTLADEDDPLNWTLGRGGVGGLRRSYPLLSGDHIHTYLDPNEVESASGAAQAPPIFWLARRALIEEAPEQPYSYTLVVIGSFAPLAELQLGFSKPVSDVLTTQRLPASETINDCTRHPVLPVAALVLPDRVLDIQLHAELHSSDGSFVPINISALDYFATVSEAKTYFDCVGFAVHALSDPGKNGYALFMVLNEDGAGPPGPQGRVRCSRWSGNNWWSRWLRAWYHC